jgi:hypothetical protein
MKHKRTPDDFAAEMRGRLNARIAGIPIPDRMRHLPLSPQGFPVPWFVGWIDGEPDFRTIGEDKLRKAIKQRLCWLCGQSVGRHLAFVIGPMCAVNRVASEPPCHRHCAEYAVKACPFLTQPRMRRNEKDKPEGTMAGVGILRNPGVTLIWITHDYKMFRPDPRKAGLLFNLGPPKSIAFYREGRPATRAEILESIDSGLPILKGIAVQQGGDALTALDRQYRRALQLLPAA